MIVLRLLGAGVVLTVGFLALSTLQKKFDDGDLRKAIKAIQAKEPSATGCRAEMVSRLGGRVRVVCENRSWIVDVVRGEIRPGS